MSYKFFESKDGTYFQRDSESKPVSAERIMTCLNAMDGIDDPVAARAIIDDPRTQAATDMIHALNCIKAITEARVVLARDDKRVIHDFATRAIRKAEST